MLPGTAKRGRIIRKWSPIGVAFDGRAIRAAQLALTPASWRLEAALCLPRTPAAAGVAPDAPIDAREVAELRDVLSRQGFHGRRIVLAVPEERLVADLLEVPPRASGAPVDDIARAELANMHGYDPKEAETVCWDLPPSRRARNTAQVMVVACRHADAEALLEVFEGAGLVVTALDGHLHAIVRALRPLLAPAGITAVVDLGWDRALLGLVCQGTIIYRRAMPEASVRLLSQALAEGLHLEADAVDCLLTDAGGPSPACQIPSGRNGDGPPGGARAQDAATFEAVSALIARHLKTVSEAMRLSFSYAGQEYAGLAVAQVLLTGRGAAMPGAAQGLERELGTSVRAVGATDVGACRAPPDARAANLALVDAVGLARFPPPRLAARQARLTARQEGIG